MKLSLKEWCIKNHKEYLINEWDAEKNRKELGFEIEDATHGMVKRVWWKCSKHSHGWQAVIYSRSGGAMCPVCERKKVLAGFNDLATVNPSVAKEWHPTKNGNTKATDVISGGDKKAWWKCKKHGHEWETTISSRTSGKSDCPYCTSQKVLAGFNDLATTNPELAEEWHPTKNDILKPTDVTAGSGRRVWWKCKKHEHEWIATVVNRNNGTDCPYCTNKKVLAGFNDLATTNPELAEEWHPTKNGDLKPTGVFAGSNKKAWWKCKKHGHEWDAVISRRNRGGDCPYCTSQKVLTGFNDLATTNPELAEEWHPTKNGILKPTGVFAGSNKKAWWKCKKHGHEWTTLIAKRNDGTDCPYCVNNKVLAGFNDLATTNPEVAEEWHPTKNGFLKPTGVFAGSNKKAWWKCKKHGHEWEAAISSRNSGCNCPKCFNNGTSFPEQYLYHIFKSKFDSVSNRTKIDDLEYDIHIKDIDLLIEYDGIYWHRIFKNKEERENMKLKLAQKRGIDFIRVFETEDKDKSTIKKGVINIRQGSRIEDLNAVAKLIIKHINEKYDLNIGDSIPDHIEEEVREMMRDNAA